MGGGEFNRDGSLDDARMRGICPGGLCGCMCKLKRGVVATAKGKGGKVGT